jgi:hypothetical protein
MKPNIDKPSFCVGLRKTLNPTYKPKSALSLPSPKKMGEEKKKNKKVSPAVCNNSLLIFPHKNLVNISQ